MAYQLETRVHYRLHAVYANGEVNPFGNPIPEHCFDEFVEINLNRLGKEKSLVAAEIVDFEIRTHVNECQIWR